MVYKISGLIQYGVLFLFEHTLHVSITSFFDSQAVPSYSEAKK